MKNHNSFIGAIEMGLVSIGILTLLTLAAVWTRLGDLTGILGVSSVPVVIQNQSPQSGSIVGVLAGFDCGSICQREFNRGDVVSLNAEASLSKQISKWSIVDSNNEAISCREGVQNAQTCSFVVPDSATTVTAEWSYSQYGLTVAKSGNGSGVVTGPGLNCGDDCSTSWVSGQPVSINAIPDAGSEFAGWQLSASDCSSAGSSTECKIDSSDTIQGKTAIAKFVLAEIEQEQDQTPEPTSTPNPGIQPTEVIDTSPTINPVVLRDSSGAIVEWSDEKPAIFQPGDPINLSSVTEPGTIVRLFIFSDPIEVVVNADQNGEWKHSVTDIESGDHRVEMELENPETGSITDRLKVLSFTVANTATSDLAETVEPEPTASLSWLSILIQLILPLFAVIVIFFMYRYIVKVRPLQR